MDPNTILIANVVIATFVATTIGFAVAWARTRERAIRAELRQPQLAPEAEARLEQIQQSVDAIALEVERISEAQRFAAKLLAERAADRDRPRQPERVVTPH